MKKKYLLLLVILLATKLLYAQDPYLGEVRLFASNYPPKGWMKCEGQTLAISTNQALFSLLGTTYGGDGRTTFAIPDLRERMPVSPNPTNSNNGLSAVTLGDVVTSSNTINASNLPLHNHFVSIKAVSGNGSSKVPSSAVSMAAPVQNFNNSDRDIAFYNQSAPDITLQATSLSISPVGSGASVTQQQPILSTNYCIAITGVYPQRN